MNHVNVIQTKSIKFRTWLVMGSEINWDTAIAQPLPIWGLRDRYLGEFSGLTIGDYLIFYAISPVKGIIGLGTVKDKYIDRQNLIWEDEKKFGKVIWPLRFRISVLHLLTKNLWHKKTRELSPIVISDLKIMWRIGFQELSPEYATRIFKRIEETWGIGLGKGATLVTTPVSREEVTVYEPEKEPIEVTPRQRDYHNRIQETIAEVGKLQYYFTELEYPLQNRRLDVVWKREAQGVPTFAFEIEISGGIERALTKLRLAFQFWNSRPLLIVPKDEHHKVESLTQKEERVFKENIQFYDPAIFEELLSKKTNLRSFEEKYRIY